MQLLAIKLDHIGDFALAVPGLYQAHLSGTEIDVVVSKWNQEWKQIVPWIRKWWVSDITSYDREGKSIFSKLNGFLTYPRLALELSAENYEAAIDLRMVRGDWRGKLLAGLSCAPIRIGSSDSGESYLSYVHKPTAIHIEDQIKERLSLAVPMMKNDNIIIDMGSLAKIPSNRKKVVFHPGSGAPARQWIQQHWVEMINQLMRMNPSGVDFYMMGGKGDILMIGNVLSRVNKKSVSPIFPSTLKEALAEISTSSLLVCMNSSAQHLARLVGTPTITIFSGTDFADQWAAKGDNTVFTSKPTCSPCHLHACNQPAHYCMENIRPEEVARVIIEKLKILA